MKNKIIYCLKTIILSAAAFGLFIGSFAYAAANNRANAVDSVLYGSNGNLETFVCNSLISLGLGCGPSSNNSASNFSNLNNNSGNSQTVSTEPPGEPSLNSSLQASITNFSAGRSISNDEVVLVKISGNLEIKSTLGLNTNHAVFEIIKGQKHFIPTIDVFFDYGFDLNSVQDISKYELDKFPRTKLVKAKGGDKRIHYITEGNRIRPILNRDVFESYGNREEDVITISEKEFNFYPRNQFIFSEDLADNINRDYSRKHTLDIFQIDSNGVKRYIVPQMVRKMRIRAEDAAPVNKTELDSYDYGSPIMF